MYDKLVDFMNIWGQDIRTISIKHYDDCIECLVNGHYILTLNK